MHSHVVDIFLHKNNLSNIFLGVINRNIGSSVSFEHFLLYNFHNYIEFSNFRIALIAIKMEHQNLFELLSHGRYDYHRTLFSPNLAVNIRPLRP